MPRWAIWPPRCPRCRPLRKCDLSAYRDILDRIAPMEEDIRITAFSHADALRFSRRVDACVAVLADLLSRPWSAVEPLTLGAELELHLIDAAARPALAYERVAALLR